MRPCSVPDGFSLGDLADLLIGWEAGEVSEGRLVELTGLDRLDLRGLRLASIERAKRLTQRTPEEALGVVGQTSGCADSTMTAPAKSSP